MKSHQKKHIIGVLLLCLYISCYVPSMEIFHHHSQAIEYAYADRCELTIYYSYADEGCAHKTHLTENRKLCYLCEHHLTFTQIVGNAVVSQINCIVAEDSYFIAETYPKTYTDSPSGRDPPSYT